MKNSKKFVFLLLVAVLALGLGSCGKKNDPDPTPEPVEETLESVKAKAVAEVAKIYAEVSAKFDSYTEEDVAAFKKAKSDADALLAAADSKEAVASALTEIKKAFDDLKKVAKAYATGVYSFVASSYDERTEILGILEAYAYEHFLTGFSFIDDGAYQLYSRTVKRGVDTYVPGYGWATLTDGEILADLKGESKAEWKRYYHTFETEDPKHINYADDKGSVVGDLIGYVASAYWDTRLNETQDGYEWYPLLAKEKPQAVNANANTGLATKYSWKLRTGSDVTYATLTNNATLAKYNGREVAAEDYLTMYKLYYTKAYGWARSAENLTGAGSIKGSEAYYNASANGFNEEAWKKVGLKVETVDGETVMTVKFNSPCTPFYAMYYMASSMFSPVPMEFITDLGTMNGGTDAADKMKKGAALFGKTSNDLGLSPVDTFLSCGVYTIEAWNADEEIVFKRNPNFTLCGADRYKIAGLHFDILAAANNDIEAAWKEFNAGNLSSCGVPSTQTQDRTRNDEFAYAVYTPGGSVFKLNVNACTPELWEKLFGENGTISKTKKENYWDVEPAMSNTDFLLGLSWSLDRQKLAKSLGRGASINYFGDSYLSDPENGVVYNTTDAHKEAVKALTNNGAAPDGYDLEIAKTYFDTACQKFIEDGTYKSGDEITIEIAWQANAQFTNYGDPIIEMWQTAFNSVGATYGLKLKVTNWASAVWSDVYYKKMMVGQFDIGFGSISGNALNPINFLEVLKSDNSSGFTLNWGADTSVVDLEYKGELWSFDSLWQAADTGGYFDHGVYTPAFAPDMVSASHVDEESGEEYTAPTPESYVENEDGSVTLLIDVNPLKDVDGLDIDVESVAFDGYNAKEEYVEWACEFTYDKETGRLVVTVEKEAVDVLFGEDNAYLAYGLHYVMIDIYFNNSYNEVPATEVATVKFAPEFIEEVPAAE